MGLKLDFTNVDDDAHLGMDKEDGSASVLFFSSEEVVLGPRKKTMVGTGMKFKGMSKRCVWTVQSPIGCPFKTHSSMWVSFETKEIFFLIENLSYNTLVVNKVQPISLVNFFKNREVIRSFLTFTERKEIFKSISDVEYKHKVIATSDFFSSFALVRLRNIQNDFVKIIKK